MELKENKNIIYMIKKDNKFNEVKKDIFEKVNKSGKYFEYLYEYEIGEYKIKYFDIDGGHFKPLVKKYLERFRYKFLTFAEKTYMTIGGIMAFLIIILSIFTYQNFKFSRTLQETVRINTATINKLDIDKMNQVNTYIKNKYIGETDEDVKNKEYEEEKKKLIESLQK